MEEPSARDTSAHFRYRPAIVHASAVLLAVLRLTLRLELGAEYDSNANRTDVSDKTSPPTGSALIRTTARGALTWKRGRNLLQAQAGLGAKGFFNEIVGDQSVLIVQGGIVDRLRLSRRSELSLSGDYYEAFQGVLAPACANCLTRRDFRTATAGLRLSLFDGPGAFWLGAGYRGFIFKPDQTFDFHAPTADAGASASIALGTPDNPHDLTFAATYRIERRAFAGPRQVRGDRAGCFKDPLLDGDCIFAGDDTRSDWFHEMSAELAYVGTVLASVGYTAQLIRSNSFGEPLLRNIITLRLAYRLPWEIYATLKAQLMLTRYFDPILVDTRLTTINPLLGFEDENRNAVIVDLERSISKKGLFIDLRYSFFSNQLSGTASEFRRHVAYLGLTYRFATR